MRCCFMHIEWRIPKWHAWRSKFRQISKQVLHRKPFDKKVAGALIRPKAATHDKKPYFFHDTVTLQELCH